VIRRCLASLGAPAAVLAVVALAPVPAGGQAPAPAATTQSAAAKTWTSPRTPWGEPDLQGVWTYEGATPLQRPKEFAGREFLTDAEVAQRTKAEQERLARNLAGADGRHPLKESTLESGALNSFWLESGSARKVSRRTSLIVGPDGLIPYTSEMLKRAAAQAEVHAGRYPTPFFHQTWLEFDTEERCLTHGVPGAMLAGAGEGPNQILQSPGYVVILQESFVDRRTIPTDGRPHGNIRSWREDSIGRWEGDTLVVETINFADKSHYRWAGASSGEWRPRRCASSNASRGSTRTRSTTSSRSTIRQGLPDPGQLWFPSQSFRYRFWSRGVTRGITPPSTPLAEFATSRRPPQKPRRRRDRNESDALTRRMHRRHWRPGHTDLVERYPRD
jgi:hypothetical protein